MYGGIYRPVYLEIAPQQHISRVAVSGLANGKLTADVFLDKAPPGSVVSGQVYTLTGQKFGLAFQVKANKDDTVAHLQTNIASPKYVSRVSEPI